MKSKALVIAMTMAVLLEAGSISVSAKQNQYVATRLGGQNRIETSVQIANNYSSGSLQAVVIATANDFPEALVGSTLASKYKAPILLVNQTARESQDTLEYIKSHLSLDGTVYILGDTSSVSSDIESALKFYGYNNIKRLAGSSKDSTFKAINDEVSVSQGTPVFVASSDMFPDALSASGISAVKGYPIILCSNGILSETALSQLKSINPSQVYVAGGTAVIPDSVVQTIQSNTGLSGDKVIRLSGQNRYDTSLAIDRYFNLTTRNAVVASGENFPDALAGSALSAKNNAPIVLVNEGDINKQKEYLDATPVQNLSILGGEGVLSQNTVDKLTAKYQKIRLGSEDPYATSIRISDEFAKNNAINGSHESGEYVKDSATDWWRAMAPTDITNSFTTNDPVSNCILIEENDKATAVGCVPLSVYLNAPVLITGKDSLNEQTAAQLKKLNIKNVYIGGGTSIISDSVEQQLKLSGFNTIRYAGKDTIETNRLMMKAIPQDLLGPHPRVLNEDDWVQCATASVNVKYYDFKFYCNEGSRETYINPIYLIKSDAVSESDFSDITAALKPIRDKWESKEAGSYRTYADSHIADNYRAIHGQGVSTNAMVTGLYYKCFLEKLSLSSGYNKDNTSANIWSNVDDSIYGQGNVFPYQVKGILMINKDNAKGSLSVPSLSAKYAMPVLFTGKSSEAIMGSPNDTMFYFTYFKAPYQEDNRLYYVGSESQVPDGSEHILNEQ
ncbi:cell wall-binding repeat-containing protein [Clostridium sp.]|uniref:cell wall-binding repeat-containing protein n=1 Tax=Clostridium sp. TaxID=1506 RepID=UPI002FDDBE17